MKSAIEAVQKKELSARKAAIAFYVPKDALHRRIKRKITTQKQLFANSNRVYTLLKSVDIKSSVLHSLNE